MFTFVLNSLLSLFSFIIWGWKAEPLKFKVKLREGFSSTIFIFEFSFVIVLVTNLGLIIFIFLPLLLPLLSLFISKKLFDMWDSFSPWTTLKGKFILCSGIGEIIFVSCWFGTRKESVSSGFFINGWVFWEFEKILFWFIFFNW